MLAWRRRRRDGNRDRGAALIEAAIVLPLVLLLAMAVLEFGFAWRDANQVERSLQNAGRVVSNLGRSRYADYEALRTINSQLQGMAGAEVERVVIWEASSSDGEPPSSCLTMAISAGGPNGNSGQRCNVYSAQQLATESLAGFPGTTDCGGGWDNFFCPPTRRDTVDPDLTYIGIYIRVEYTPFTSVISGPTIDIERSTVYRVEPCVPIVSPCV
jgi:hypothetical protein